MIEILDKINDITKFVEDDIDLIIHPLNKETTFLQDMQLEGKKITSIIFKEDGTTMILYNNIDDKKQMIENDNFRLEILKEIRKIVKGVPIKWDRVIDMGFLVQIYGWIPYDEKRSDFILFTFEKYDSEIAIRFTTSSVKFSKRLHSNLMGKETEEGHTPCIRFKDYFKEYL